jgi:hypothetical protein
MKHLLFDAALFISFGRTSVAILLEVAYLVSI